MSVKCRTATYPKKAHALHIYWASRRMSLFLGAVRPMRTSLRYPYPSCRSGSEKAAPLSESGAACLLEGVAVLDVAIRWKVVVDRGMDGGKLLQRSHAPKSQHRPLSSSKRQVRILCPVVEPAYSRSGTQVQRRRDFGNRVNTVNRFACSKSGSKPVRSARYAVNFPGKVRNAPALS